MACFYVCDILFQTSGIYVYVRTFFLPFPSETWNGSGVLDGPLPIQWSGSPASLWWKLSHGASQRRLLQAWGKCQLWLLLKQPRHNRSDLPHSDVSLLLPSVACTSFVLPFLKWNLKKSWGERVNFNSSHINE